MEQKILTAYEKWLASDKVSEEMKAELIAIRDNEEELKLRFSAPLSFGTAGLRGVMAAGIGNMNVHTVAHATRAWPIILRCRAAALWPLPTIPVTIRSYSPKCRLRCWQEMV